jgi:iron complex transport system ATP-binding protein
MMHLQASKLNVGYGNKVVFPNISFAANEGDMIALLGVNGIGKSTLLRTLSGLQKPISGSITIAEKELDKLSAADKAKLVSIVLTERIYIENIRARDFIALGRSPYTSWLGKLSDKDEEIVRQVISVMNLQMLSTKYFNEMSDGERQKTLIARALCQQTPLIILDEPTAFLDFRNKRDILGTLKNISEELKKTIIFSTHDIEAAFEHCNKCWIMNEQQQFIEVRQSANFAAEVKQILEP